jgi:hypothetical protein
MIRRNPKATRRSHAIDRLSGVMEHIVNSSVASPAIEEFQGHVCAIIADERVSEATMLQITAALRISYNLDHK